MVYTMLTGVFLTLFLVIGSFAFYGFLLRMLRDLPLSWICYQQVIVLTIVAVLCFIAAGLFGIQIPDCYVG
jgi:hypothetical protein